MIDRGTQSTPEQPLVCLTILDGLFCAPYSFFYNAGFGLVTIVRKTLLYLTFLLFT